MNKSITNAYLAPWLIFVMLVLLFSTVGGAYAVPLWFSFSDPVGDAYLFPGEIGPVTDVEGLVFSFDNETGDYEITMIASAVNPFIGDVIINVNLFNPDTGTTASNPSFFHDGLNQFSLSTPSTTITLTGSNPRLLSWNAGDRVSACSGPGGLVSEPCKADLGLPDDILSFRSGVINGQFGEPFVNIARDNFQDPPTATIALVDEPVTVSLDIKPGSFPNPLNVSNTGVLPVAILGTDDFDVTTIDPASVRLVGVSPIRWAMEDVATPYEEEIESCDACHELRGDGYTDLILKFNAQEVVAAIGEVEDGECLILELTGNLKVEFERTPIEGEDVVLILKNNER